VCCDVVFPFTSFNTRTHTHTLSEWNWNEGGNRSGTHEKNVGGECLAIIYCRKLQLTCSPHSLTQKSTQRVVAREIKIIMIDFLCNVCRLRIYELLLLNIFSM
jgi:hypothetical protein